MDVNKHMIIVYKNARKEKIKEELLETTCSRKLKP